MEETTVESFAVDESNRNSSIDGDATVNDTTNTTDNTNTETNANDGKADNNENGNDLSSSEAPTNIKHENSLGTSAEVTPVVPVSSSPNSETQNQYDIPRNTPPPAYSGENESKNIVGVPGTSSMNAEKSANEGVLAGPDNFWLVGNYKKVTKRIEDGSKLCEALSQMILERSEIENLYARKLKAWNKKWNQAFSKELEYGTVLQSLLKGLSESNEIADVHLAICGKLSEVSSQVLKWKAESYHRGIIGLKEVKKADEGFGKAQKPWAKKYDDTVKGRQNYHSACQVLDSVRAQEEELKTAKDATTQEQLAKVQNKVKKAMQDRETSLDFYKESLRDISGYNQKYKDDMTHQYDKWESADKTRKDFVIEKMKLFKECVDISQFQSRIENIYVNMSEVYSVADSATDLEFFRNNFGPNMPFIDISFIEYNPEAPPIAKPKAKDLRQTAEASCSQSPKEKSKVCVAL